MINLDAHLPSSSSSMPEFFAKRGQRCVGILCLCRHPVRMQLDRVLRQALEQAIAQHFAEAVIPGLCSRASTTTGFKSTLYYLEQVADSLSFARNYSAYGSRILSPGIIGKALHRANLLFQTVRAWEISLIDCENVGDFHDP